MMTKLNTLFLLVVLATTVLPLPALAVDGVVEINQAKVLANGGSFPFFIIRPGSYRLTSNLSPPANTNAIVVQDPGVTIDLNGFSFIGSGGASGVFANVNENRVTVKNGQVTGFADGIHLNKDSRVENVRATGNSQNGISCSDGCTVTGCEASNNGGAGIVAAAAPAPAGSIANAFYINGNTASGNGGSGIFLTGGGVVKGNATAGNGTDSAIGDPFFRAGITTQGAGFSIVGNSATVNTGFGLAMISFDGYADNVLHGNDGNGTPGDTTNQASGGINLGHNACNGALCP
jgi:hypothetical protein